MATKKKSGEVMVRVNASHDGLRRGQVYRMVDTTDLRLRAEAGRLTILADPAPPIPASTKAQTTDTELKVGGDDGG